MSKEIFVKKPIKKLIVVENTSLTIKRLGKLAGSDKTIPYDSITSILIKKPSLTNGYIKFSGIGGLLSELFDENTVVFTKKNWDDMVWLKDFIESKQNMNSFDIKSNEGKSSIELIKEYKELADTGIITQEEFEKKKAQLLDL